MTAFHYVFSKFSLGISIELSSMALFIRKLSESEEKRMNQFGIKLETDIVLVA